MTSSGTRREEIVRLATTAGAANVEDLAIRFSVTASTIRRDLAALNTQGKLARTYGGALGLVAHPEASLRERMGAAYEKKGAIARWAAAQVQPGESLLLDAGSTVAAVAHELRSARDLRVATVGLTVLQELADVSGIQVECLGGRLRRLSQGFLGALTEAALERMTFNRVFLSADAVTPGKGICEADLEQTRLKELMARRAEKIYVLAHGAKLGKTPFHAWARLPLPWNLVTDNSASKDVVNAFIAEGVTVVVVGGLSV
ncbi:DeoR/GlpR family DNA-binding transcription regulator [Cryobacterium sp. Y11]|uniref:DeoR/GlpR family DNA-binding transcription regulator n=1 Tax=Cryobacterium sp. Y11 TaxID=2045016 RepID=UPI000CE35DD7|nr:DeoR/GlpR family DNA-binding transcription regulator [Cryobacterium sp. Y11]